MMGVYRGDSAMPIYEYKCVSCGQVDEHLMRFSDPDPTECTKCGSSVQKIVSQTSFSLKGEGWYVTDYKKQPSPAGTGETPVTTKETTPASDTPAPAAAGEKAPASQPEKAAPAKD
jgi:putative FmdB family regulatory protein